MATWVLGNTVYHGVEKPVSDGHGGWEITHAPGEEYGEDFIFGWYPETPMTMEEFTKAARKCYIGE